MKLKTLLLAAAFVCANAFAAPPSDESLERWLDTQHYDRDIETYITDGFNAGFKPYSDRVLAQVPEEKKGRAAEVIDRYRERVLKDLISPEVKQSVRSTLLNNAKSTFTQEEIDGMTAFYSTPVGRSVMDKNPLFLKKSMDEMETLAVSMGQAGERHRPELIKALKEIMCSGKHRDAVCAPSKHTGKKHKK